MKNFEKIPDRCISSRWFSQVHFFHSRGAHPPLHGHAWELQSFGIQNPGRECLIFSEASLDIFGINCDLNLSAFRLISVTCRDVLQEGGW